MQIGDGVKGDSVVCLLSGGMDSATTLWWCKENFKDVYVVSFDYGQRHRRELEVGAELALRAGARERKVIKVDLTQIGGSPLNDPNINVPRKTENRQRSTVVPYRNTILMAMAVAYGETRGVHDIAMGPCAEDYQEYPDCREDYFKALNKALLLGATHAETAELRFHLPYIKTYKKDIVKDGERMGVPYHITHTCYEGTEIPCAVRDLNRLGAVYSSAKHAQTVCVSQKLGCDACYERLAAFEDNDICDPLLVLTYSKAGSQV